MAEELTTRDHWSETLHRPKAASKAGAVKRALRSAIGRERLDRITSSYSEERYWQIVMGTVGPSQGKKSVEVGSAPGEYSIALHRRLGCEPFGIEYTADGAQANREAFAAGGINPANVIEGDFFDDAVTREQFDIVFSRGFIEHFTDPRPVIARHIALLKDGGHLIITIPRMRGLGYLLTRLCGPWQIEKHNLKIMSRRAFAALFEGQDVRPLYCGFLAGIGIQPFTATSSKRWVRRAGSITQKVADIALRAFPRIESELVSPHLLFVGVKKSRSSRP